MPYREGAVEVRKKATVECGGLSNTHYAKLYIFACDNFRCILSGGIEISFAREPFH